MKKKKKIIIWVVVLLVLFAGGFFYAKSKQAKTNYTTSKVERGDLAQTISVTGEILPTEQADLAFKASGLVENVFVEIGDKVTAGQKLASLNKDSLAIEFKQAQEDIKYQKEALDNMEEHWKTYSSDQRSGQRALVRKAQESLRGIQILLKDNNIYSPIDGIITKKDIKKGETATINVPIFTVAKESDFELETDVPESDIIKVALDQIAAVTLDAFSDDDKFEATVTNIEPASTVIQDVVYYKVKLKFKNTDPRFKYGMSADIDIIADKKPNVLMIPRRAIKTEGKKKYVEVLKDAKQDIKEKTAVTTGLEGDDGMIEIVSGLNEGNEVITLENKK